MPRCLVLLAHFAAPSTWTALGEYSSRAWSAIGPLVGVLVGALLGRSWDKRKWLKENVKQECQELLGAITKNATETLTGKEDIRNWKTSDSYLAAVQSFHTRIFIAVAVKKEGLFGRWVNTVQGFASGQDRRKFDNGIEEIREAIVHIAVRQSR